MKNVIVGQEKNLNFVMEHYKSDTIKKHKRNKIM